MNYVISDVHGNYSLLMKLLSKLKVDETKDTVYFCGDFLDRALSKTEQEELIKFYVSNFNNPDSCYKTTIGNHELEFIDGIEGYLRSDIVIDVNFTGEFSACRRLVCCKAGIDVSTQNLYLCRSLYRTIVKQPLYYEVVVNDNKYIITHSWLIDEFGNDCTCNPKDAELMNSIYDRGHSIVELSGGNGNKIIHGHTPTLIKDCIVRGATIGKVWEKQGNINVDCGSFLTLFSGGNLGAYCIETGESVYALTEQEQCDLIIKIYKSIEGNLYGELSKSDYEYYMEYLNDDLLRKYDLRKLSDVLPFFQKITYRYMRENKFLLPEYI